MLPDMKSKTTFKIDINHRDGNFCLFYDEHTSGRLAFSMIELCGSLHVCLYADSLDIQ